MSALADRDRFQDAEGQVEYFGFKLTVRRPQLVALLTAADEVQVLRRPADVPAPDAVLAVEVTEAPREPEMHAGAVVIPLRRPAQRF
jgi:hypothetical protein